jgi:hypothetical protein
MAKVAEEMMLRTEGDLLDGGGEGALGKEGIAENENGGEGK